MAKRRVVVVGGVAGGATCAARLRRLDEGAEILVVDRGSYISFANCGLPYYVGNVIHDEAALLVSTAELLHDWLNIETRTRSEVFAIDRLARTVAVRNLETGEEYAEPYDQLVLSPGAAPIRPPWPGIHLPGIFTLRTIPDSRAIRSWIETRHPRRAVVVGGGFIGLEMAENLAHRGLSVTVVEIANQVMPPFDPEMAAYAAQKLVSHGVTLVLSDGVTACEQTNDGSLAVRTQSGAALSADLVVLAIGVRPESQLARSAGLEIGARGGIRVDSQMRTSDPNIFAVGDAVEVKNWITGEWELAPLAGPANRQARVAADAICGRNTRFRGVQGTAVCGFFGMTVALTGATEKALRRARIDGFQTIYLHPNNHAAYYPGAKPMHMKVIFRKSDGLVLGAQAAGEEGVERRIDVIAQAIQLKATVFDLEEAELCYAPPFGGAKDAVNFAGMIGANCMRGDVEIAPWSEAESDSAFIVDVREPREFNADSVEGAVNIPLGQLRVRLAELPAAKEILLTCGVGMRSYYAYRILKQRGLRVRNFSGGYQTYSAIHSQDVM